MRVVNGRPVGMKNIPATNAATSVQKRGLKLARQNGYKSKNDWNDTLQYWSDEKSLSAVLFINSAYEQTTIIFDRTGNWLQTATYLNPEFTETSRILTALDEKGYTAPSLNSPIGPIIRYKTSHGSWYEAETFESKAPGTQVTVLLDGKFRVVGARR